MPTGNTRQKPRNVPKEKEKLRVFIVKVTSLRIISPVFLALEIGPEQLLVRCQAAWLMGTRRPGHVLSPLGGGQRVICRVGVCLGIDAQTTGVLSRY